MKLYENNKDGKVVDEVEHMQEKLCDKCGGPEAIFTRDNDQLCENCFAWVRGEC